MTDYILQKKKINELEGIAVEGIQTVNIGEQIPKQCNNLKQLNVQIPGVLQGRGWEEKSKEIMVKTFQTLMKTLNPQI